MSSYIINGNRRLFGEIDVQGSKNSALAILMACIITDGQSVISNLPNITDVTLALKILKQLGCDVSYCDENTVKINTKNIELTDLPAELISSMRASSYLLGALTARFGKCQIPNSGGCDFGIRPIDMHIDALCTLGAHLDAKTLYAPKGLHGGHITFHQKTVGGTVNAIIAACLSSGMTVISNCALEPHIKDLCDFLIKCGANIIGGGTNVIRIRGKTRLHGCEHTIDSDMIEAGTYICAALATKGKIKCNNAPVSELDTFLSVLKRCGAQLSKTENAVTVSCRSLSGTELFTEPYPGFPTDLQPQTTALLGLSDGKSKITEAIFKKRFGYLNELKKFGLQFTVEDNSALITGVDQYTQANAFATDLRGGAAAVICALNASGTSTVDNTELIERGYSALSKKLCSLGADIKRSI